MAGLMIGCRIELGWGLSRILEWSNYVVMCVGQSLLALHKNLDLDLELSSARSSLGLGLRPGQLSSAQLRPAQASSGALSSRARLKSTSNQARLNELADA